MLFVIDTPETERELEGHMYNNPTSRDNPYEYYSNNIT